MDLLRGSKVAVFGASGLLGRSLVDLLVKQGRDVLAFVRPDKEFSELGSSTLRYVGLDLESNFDIRKVLSEGVGQIVYLAQSPHHNTFPIGAGSVSALNVVAPHRLAEQAIETGVSRFIFASSGGVAQADTFHDTKKIKIISDEASHRTDQMGFYLTTKSQTETSLSYFNGKLSICSPRYFFMYGPQQRSEMLIPRMISSVLEGKPISLGEGRGPLLNPIHATDAALATSLLLNKDIEGTVNIAGTEIVSLGEICKLIGLLADIEPIIKTDDSVPVNFVAGINKLYDLGFESSVSLKEGLASMLVKVNR